MPANCSWYLCTKDVHERRNIMVVIEIIKLCEEENTLIWRQLAAHLGKRFLFLTAVIAGKYKCLFLALLNNLEYIARCCRCWGKKSIFLALLPNFPSSLSRPQSKLIEIKLFPLHSFNWQIISNWFYDYECINKLPLFGIQSLQQIEVRFCFFRRGDRRWKILDEEKLWNYEFETFWKEFYFQVKK